ncbi:MAG: ABC transporter permease [Peptococcaceae bacterium]|nr:ABC transporter permease [Peptococcaceae bacterium]
MTQLLMHELLLREPSIGTTPAYATVRNQPVAMGRFFNAKDLNDNAEVAVLGTTVVQNLGQTGYSIIGQVIKINSVPFQVIGVLQSKGSSGASNTDDQIIMPIPAFSRA